MFNTNAIFVRGGQGDAYTKRFANVDRQTQTTSMMIDDDHGYKQFIAWL